MALPLHTISAPDAVDLLSIQTMVEEINYALTDMFTQSEQVASAAKDFQPASDALTTLAEQKAASYGLGFLGLQDQRAARKYLGMLPPSETGGNSGGGGGGGGGGGDHGALTGLGDNDHPQYLLAASYTAADVLAKLLTVDGPGSGLDADTLDGSSAAAFATAGHNHAGVYEPADAFLTSIAALGTAADKMIYTTGINAAAEAALTSYARSLLDDADATTARATLGILHNPQGRLTLTSNTPVMSAAVSAGTIYYTPYIGDQLPTFDGSSVWTMRTFTQMSLILDATRHVIDTNYDVFAFMDGSTLRIGTGPAWATDTARGIGVGTTQLQTAVAPAINAVSMTVWNNSTSYTVDALKGTYLGTFRTSAAAVTRVDFTPTPAAGGGNARVFLWNAYNQIRHCATTLDSTNSWTYTTASYRIFNGNSNNRISFVVGQPSGCFSASSLIICTNSTAFINGVHSIGYDSETTPDGATLHNPTTIVGANVVQRLTASLRRNADIGFHYIAPLEYSTATGTCTWYGDNGNSSLYQSGISMELTI